MPNTLSRIKELDNIIRCLYGNRVTGRISPERYDTMADGYEQEQASLREKLQALNEQMTELDMREHYVRLFELLRDEIPLRGGALKNRKARLVQL